jgi:hypothetical protein
MRSGGGPTAGYRNTPATKSVSSWTSPTAPSDRNLKFHECDLTDPTPDIWDLLHEIDRDPTNIFWG